MKSNKGYRSTQNLEYLVQSVKEESERMGLYLNIKKTKVMTTVGNGIVHITIDNEESESVQDFLFLGSKIVSSGKLRTENNKRIALGHNGMQGMEKIGNSKDINSAIMI